MREHLIRSAKFFQSVLYANFRDMTPELSETLLGLSMGHLFGPYNPMPAKSRTFGELVLLFFSADGTKRKR